MGVVHPSRRALRALLRMRQIFDGTKEIPHPEEAAPSGRRLAAAPRDEERPSRRTHDTDPAPPGISSQPRKRESRAAASPGRARGPPALDPRFRGGDKFECSAIEWTLPRS